MNKRIKRPTWLGFTIIELLVVLSLIVIIGAIGYPALGKLLRKGQLISFGQKLSVQLKAGRQEAIRSGFPVAVIADFANHQIYAFVNADEDPDFVFAPDPSQPSRTTDYEIYRLYLPTDRQVHLFGPGDADPHGNDAVDSFTDVNGQQIAIFEPDGSIRDTGAFRFADDKGNFLEVRVEPAATARITLQKYNRNPAWGGPAQFYPKGRHSTSGDPLWTWS